LRTALSVTDPVASQGTFPGCNGLHILVVEDEEAHTDLVRCAFERRGSGVVLSTAGTLREARGRLAKRLPDLVIADWRLPDGEGTELVPAEKQDVAYPVVLMTSRGSEKVAVEAMKAGALDYVVKSPATMAAMPRIAERALREWGHIVGRRQAEKELQHSLERMQKALDQTVACLGSVVEKADPYTAGHQRRTAALARTLGTGIGLSQEELDTIHTAALVHDVGKVGVPAEILSRPGRLSETEFDLIKTHPRAGCDILKGIEFPGPVSDVVLQHHERLDGSGYPSGLPSLGILLEAKILAVADVVEAMTSHRPYRPALDADKALEEISKNSAILYDPDVVDTCVGFFQEGRLPLAHRPSTPDR